MTNVPLVCKFPLNQLESSTNKKQQQKTTHTHVPQPYRGGSSSRVQRTNPVRYRWVRRTVSSCSGCNQWRWRGSNHCCPRGEISPSHTSRRRASEGCYTRLWMWNSSRSSSQTLARTLSLNSTNAAKDSHGLLCNTRGVSTPFKVLPKIPQCVRKLFCYTWYIIYTRPYINYKSWKYGARRMLVEGVRKDFTAGF